MAEADDKPVDVADLPVIDGGPPVGLEDMVPKLQRHVRSFGFTPFIGSECSVINRKDTDVWKALAAVRIDGLLKKTEGDAARYLRSLAKEHGCDSENAPETGRRKLPDSSGAVESLRICLAELGAHATTEFGEAMTEHVKAVSDTPTYEVELDRNASRKLMVYLVKACVAAADIENSGAESDLFDAGGVFFSLIRLAEIITGGRFPDDVMRRVTSEQDQERRSKVVREISQADAANGQKLPVSLYQLEWMADLLWHTIRFDVPVYLTDAELAFQIALKSPQERFMRPPLPTAAEIRRLQWEQFHPLIRHYGSDAAANTQMKQFYEAIARYLHHQFLHWEETKGQSDAIEPVAVSTTFDLELERALRDETDCFHVAIPVVMKGTSGIAKHYPPVKWVIGTWNGEDEIDNPHDWHAGPSEGEELNFKGPLIVKLHGSPLHHLPGPDDVEQLLDPPYPNRILQHSLTLSESEYLMNIIPLAKSGGKSEEASKFLFNMLDEDARAVFFLGHSVGEWNTRLRIYDEAFKRNVHLRDGRFVAVNEKFDPYRTAVLRTFGVERWQGGLGLFREKLREAMKFVG